MVKKARQHTMLDILLDELPIGRTKLLQQAQLCFHMQNSALREKGTTKCKSFDNICVHFERRILSSRLDHFEFFGVRT